MSGIISLFLSIFTIGLITSCSRSEITPISPLITHSLHANPKQNCFEGIWYNPEETSFWSSSHMKVYIAPVNIDFIKAQFPKEAPLLAKQFREELCQDIAHALKNKSLQSQKRITWQLVDHPSPNGVTLTVAIVKLKPTNVGGNIMSDLVSLFSPITGTSILLSRFMSGDVGIEGCLSNTETKTPIMEFQAFNTDPITLFSIKEFERFAFDKQNLQLFSGCISSLFIKGPSENIPKPKGIDLSPF